MGKLLKMRSHPSRSPFDFSLLQSLQLPKPHLSSGLTLVGLVFVPVHHTLVRDLPGLDLLCLYCYGHVQLHGNDKYVLVIDVQLGSEVVHLMTGTVTIITGYIILSELFMFD